MWVPRSLGFGMGVLSLSIFAWNCHSWIYVEYLHIFCITLLLCLQSNSLIELPHEMKYFNFFFLVCRARYEDAKFFYEMDTRKKFSEFRSQLKGILFHVGYFILYVFMKKMIYLLGIREFVVVLWIRKFSI